MQKLLSMVFLPSFCPVSGLVYSQVQWRVPMTCLPASVWQLRQALVTSEPLANGPCSSLNLLWSAVDLDDMGAAASACAALSSGAGAAAVAPARGAASASASPAASARQGLRRCRGGGYRCLW
ncbi:hypothetical protein FQZ97_914490 [compost metagenome]